MVFLNVDSGISSRKHVTQKFKENRYQMPRKLYQWKKRPIGRRALVHIYLIAREYGTDDDLLTKPPRILGLRAWVMFEKLKQRCPEWVKDFQECTGEPPTEKDVMSRFGNMFRNNQRRNFEFGPEHPKNHPSLNRILIEEMQRLKHGTN